MPCWVVRVDVDNPGNLDHAIVLVPCLAYPKFNKKKGQLYVTEKWSKMISRAWGFGARCVRHGEEADPQKSARYSLSDLRGCS